MAQDKAQLVAAFGELLADRLASLRATQQAARTGMRVDGGHRPANRGERAAVTSQGYLAAGLAERIAGLEANLVLLKTLDLGPRSRVGAGALVVVEREDEQEQIYFLLPGAQGDTLGTEGQVLALSPASPRARSLVGLEAGDSCIVSQRGQETEVTVRSVE